MNDAGFDPEGVLEPYGVANGLAGLENGFIRSSSGFGVYDRGIVPAVVVLVPQRL